MGKSSRIDSHFRRYQRRGDPADLGRVFDAAAGEMLRIARGYSRGDEALAEDAVQSVFLIAMEKAADFDGARRVMPWLLGILANELRRERDRAERVPHPRWLQEGANARSPEDPRAVAADAELKALIQSKVKDLPETYREAVSEHLFSSLDAGEVAERLGISRSALHVRVHRGLGLLKGLLPAGAATAAGLVAFAPRGLAAVRGDLMVQVGGGMGGGAAASSALAGAGAGAGIAGKGAILVTSIAAALAGVGIGSAAVVAWNDREMPSPERIALQDVEPGATSAVPPLSAASPDREGPSRARLDRAREQQEIPRMPAPKAEPSAVADAASADDAALSEADWLKLYAEARGFLEISILGRRIVDLPGDRGLELARRLYPRLSVATRKQFGKPFLFQEGAPYGLEVADWIVNDPEASVREFGWSFLRRYALVDFDGDHAAYAEWRAATAEQDRAETLRTSARWLAESLRSATDEEALLRLSSGIPPSDRTLEAVGMAPSELFADTDLAQRLVPWLDPSNEPLAKAAAAWLPFTDASEGTYRTFVLPLLDAGSPALRSAAARALVWGHASFAPEELLVRFPDGPAPISERALALTQWKNWFNER
ncbi:MAG: sigma-70 family RNA polymerase sigma factor [Planctomycetota bacterium]